MKILALEKESPDVTTEQIRPFLVEEAARVWELYLSGVLREFYFRQDWPGAVLMLECAHEADAAETLSTLPLVREGLITFDLIPLGPYPGFARLFVTEAG